MNVNYAELLISAVRRSQHPQSDCPEIAFAGRSNVGKSSLINKLANRKKLARTSASPGKTATINFYDIEHRILFADLPGYGYAKVSWAERERWAKMINEYLTVRQSLKSIFLLVDARHKPTKDDITMFDWIVHSPYDYRIIATKADKISKTAAQKSVDVIAETLQAEKDRIILFSAQTGLGREEIWEYIETELLEEDTP